MTMVPFCQNCNEFMPGTTDMDQETLHKDNNACPVCHHPLFLVEQMHAVVAGPNQMGMTPPGGPAPAGETGALPSGWTEVPGPGQEKAPTPLQIPQPGVTVTQGPMQTPEPEPPAEEVDEAFGDAVVDGGALD